MFRYVILSIGNVCNLVIVEHYHIDFGHEFVHLFYIYSFIALKILISVNYRPILVSSQQRVIMKLTFLPRPTPLTKA